MAAMRNEPLPFDQYYPYKRVQGYGTMPNLELIPRMVRDYLMDMPSKGYNPPDDNRSFRCQLMKYLYYDDADPLSHPLPTPAQKLSIVYDTSRPDNPPDKTKGYRIFSQEVVTQAQTLGQTIMRIYMGRAVPVDTYTVQASIILQFFCNGAYETHGSGIALQRSFAMTCLAERALSGVNFGAGVGTIFFDRRQMGDNNIYLLDDESTNVGYRLTMGLTVIGTDDLDQ